jgi:ATP-dependent helicase/nuclease subunit A
MTSPDHNGSDNRPPQARATDPAATVWVSANAGSGKTYVLSRRVIRLMLEGADPSSLLCLTFTKAAAAEMANRVFEILGRWSVLEEDKLLEEIGELIDTSPRPEIAKRARQLFALALDAPGGLKIQTIHAFCEALLHRFTLEANIPGHFEMMDDIDRSMLLEEARNRVIRASLTGKDMERRQLLAKSFETIRSIASDDQINKAIDHLIRRRDDFSNWIENSAGKNASSALDPMWTDLGLNPQDRPEDLNEAFRSETAYDAGNLNALINALREKGGISADSALALIEEMQSCSNAGDHHQLRQKLVLTKGGDPRAYLVSTKFLTDNGLMEAFREEQAILENQIQQLKGLSALAASEALFTIADQMLMEFANLKETRGLLDFEDLIERAANLLSRTEISQWIQYKLDGGISHVLVDEAQDTSPLQWQIIEAIIQEFFSGTGASSKTRTLFVVGDLKQSIYSFQGADPGEFLRQFRNIRLKVTASGNRHNVVSLNDSYRSTPEVLSAVDQVFSLEDNRRGLGDASLIHTARKRHTHRGEVLLWEPEIRTAKQEKSDWLAPPDATRIDDAEVRLAKRIASTIKEWIDREEKLPGREDKIRYGDILILVRRRDRFVEAINRELKRQGLVSAGADRLALNQHIVVEDMIVLGRFASTKMDDLSLAGLLKSPLFGFDDDDLFAIAHGRGKRPLYEAMRQLGREAGRESAVGHLKARVTSAVSDLEFIVQLADSVPVFEFFARIFARYQLRQKYRRRMGNEVGEVIDGFLQTSINYDSRHGLGLQGFVEWLKAANLELKREVDMRNNEIRVITAHSSKGLEAPIVFLVDPGSAAFSHQHAPPIVTLETTAGQKAWLWQAAKSMKLTRAEPAFDMIKADAEEEYRRLLYVGMTRAADRLILCGYRPEKPPTFSHWLSMVKSGLEAPLADAKSGGELVGESDEHGNFLHWRWVIGETGRHERLPAESESGQRSELAELPAWLTPVANEQAPPRPITPSGVMGLFEVDEDSTAGFALGSEEALARGNAIHDLLQVVPGLEDQQVEKILQSYFAGPGSAIGDALAEEIKMQIRQLMANPEFAPLLRSPGRSEAEITGTIYLAGKEQMIRGRIDRIVLMDGLVVIIDYKTNQVVPSYCDAIPAQYVGQMALYRNLVQALYPDKRIACKLVWTQAGEVMDVSDLQMDNWFAQVNHK